MFRKLFLVTLTLITFWGCSQKVPNLSRETIVIFKTPVMKFYDRGFVNVYDNHINLQVFEVGKLALNLTIYKDKICQSTFQCLSGEEFNKKYLHPSYKKDFLYNLFSKNEIYHKDKQNNIFIKVK